MKPFAQLLAIGLLLCSCSQAQVKEYGVRVVKEFPHDTGAYTQGLFFHEGVLYETTGQYGDSSIRTVDLETGEPVLLKKLNNKYFGEGSVILDGVLYVLTWTNKVAFRYKPENLAYQSTVSYPREGWGITTDGKQLIASDGSATLYFMDKEMKVLRRVKVTLNGRPLRNLNELEWIDGRVWANVYLTDMLVIIDPESGKVEATVDCKGLLPEKLRSYGTDVLNGIARDAGGRLYLTGKNWPRLYQVELVKKK
ncbi:MAG: glutaminyl-peptide cyclotransferase [Bacteroidales bacterium]|nr:glutaminyl-peptide cyclotransferase [Bacteroidales bacterium]